MSYLPTRFGSKENSQRIRAAAKREELAELLAFEKWWLNEAKVDPEILQRLDRDSDGQIEIYRLVKRAFAAGMKTQKTH